MKWFYRWLAKKCKHALETDDELILRWDDSMSLNGNKKSNRTSSVMDSNKGMNFILHRASGGYIVEFSTYDTKRDEWDHKIHIIPDGEDFGNTISKILTIELLSK